MKTQKSVIIKKKDKSPIRVVYGVKSCICIKCHKYIGSFPTTGDYIICSFCNEVNFI